MKKFYSLVLMAVALLVGTNAKAATFNGNTAAELQDAIHGIMSGATSDPVIKLSQNVELNRTVWVGTQNETDAYKTVTIDLNGHNITMNGVRNDKNQRVVYIMFSLTHGELNIINTGANEAKVQLTGETADNSRIVEVFGTYRSSRWNEEGNALVGAGINTRAANGGWFSHLEIGKNVLLYADQGCLAEGIAIGVQGQRAYYQTSSNSTINLNYRTDLFKSTWGFAQGVRVDFWGKMDIQGAADGKVYGFATKGLLRSALSCSATKAKGAEVLNNPAINTYAQNYYNYNGEVEATSGVTHKLDTIDAPFVWIHPESEINVRNNGDKVAAIYAAGYAKWLVQGYAAGKTGMYVSSGTVDLEDAYVKSTAEEWQNTSNIGSANGGGSGVVLNSRDSYSGDMDFVVSGDTKIESIDGYAIEEAVNTTVMVPNPIADPSNPNYDENADPYVPATNVSNVTIEGGTIIGGNEGAIVISGPTTAAMQDEDPSKKTTVVVIGGNVDGTTTVGATGDMDDLIPTTGYHTTEVTVTDPATGQEKTVIVVSQGDDPDDQETVHGQTGSVNWKWSTASTEAMKDSVAVETMPAGKTVLTLDELEINQDYDQTLIVKDGYTLNVGRVVMGEKAKIVVEPGAKFIVYGEQGIVAPKTSNIVLHSTTTKHATLLFNPNVTSNKHPNATVEYVANRSWYESATNFQWERFGIPTWTQLESIATTINSNITVFEMNGWHNLGYLMANGTPFANIAYLNKPFVACGAVAYRAQNEKAATYTFKGELVGNVDVTLSANVEWCPFANSYSADMDMVAILAGLANTATNVDEVVYLQTPSGNGTFTWNTVSSEWMDYTKIAPMQAFILHNQGAFIEDNPVNYKDMVWSPGTSNNVPRRRVAAVDENSAKMRVVVTNEEGTWDNVKMTENASNVNSAAKYMNDDVNIYAMTDEKSAIVAAENLENMYLGFSTVKGGNFTISFANVDGREFDLIDMENGAKVAVKEGATYEFTADANSANDYRFKLVERNNAPTAIDNTEAVKSATGIYTITGQYMGEMNVWNTLPAGVYVVNGEKRVK